MGSETPPLFAHQKESIEFFTRNPRTLDASSPGTGKSRSHIEWFSTHHKKNKKSALIFAPKSILQPAWGQDFSRYAPHLSVVIATASNRKKALTTPCHVLITNIDAAKEVAAQPAKWFKQFDTLIVDESTSIKNHTAMRSKCIGKIAKHFKYRRFLSGTPTSNGICDIWNQIFLLDDGVRLGKSFFGFRNAACTPVQAGPQAHMVKWTDKEGIEEKIYTLINDITVRHKFEDCVDIPANHLYSLSYELPAKHMKVYKELENYSQLLLTNTSVTALNGASLYTKLMQAASGAVYDDYDEHVLLDTGRYELVLSLVEERQHSIVFFNWKHQKEELTKLAEKKGLTWAVIDGTTPDNERADIVKHYQAGFYRVLFAHPQSAGHGLTLTRGTATIWASPTYNLEHFLQANQRIYRIGQKDKTETIVILAKNTVDEKVYEALENKKVKLTALLELLKER